MRSWQPNPGPQTDFLASTAYEGLYGGAAGGGKSDALLMGPLRYIDRPDFRALYLRRSFPELQRSAIEKSRQWFPSLGAVYNEARKQWRFRSGAVYEFGHLERDADVHSYQSAEFAWIAFDELTTFTEKQYTYMLSRARSASGIPVRIRAATNPGGEGHEWVMRRWGAWLDPKCATSAKAGDTLYYLNAEDGEQYAPKGTAGALSRVFIPARVTDNPHLIENDPSYIERLGGLDAVSRRQLRDGDWLVQPAAGLYFKSAWLPVVEHGAGHARRVRYWDRAASEGKGDYTVGLLLAKSDDGTFTVEDMTRFQHSPGQVEARIKAVTQADGREVMIGIEEDPGQAGKFESSYYVKALAGYNVRTFRPTGDKVTRALPVSAQAERGNVKVKRAPWNAAFLEELEGFPEASHDDIVDALSGAFNALTGGAVPASFTAPGASAPVSFRPQRTQWGGSINGSSSRGNVAWSAPSAPPLGGGRGGRGF